MTKHYLGRHQLRDLRSISRSHDTHMHDLTQQSMPRQAHAHATSLTNLPARQKRAVAYAMQAMRGRRMEAFTTQRPRYTTRGCASHRFLRVHANRYAL